MFQLRMKIFASLLERNEIGTGSRFAIKIENEIRRLHYSYDFDKATNYNNITPFVEVSEKLSKYKDLEIEIARTWGMKTQIVPVAIAALGVIKEGIDKQISKIPGNINVTELEKIALLGSAHILRKVLSLK